MIGSAARALVLVLAAVLLSSCAASAPPPRTFVMPPPLPPGHAWLVALFGECVSPVGPSRELPEAAEGPPLDGAYLLKLSDAGIVMDGFSHWLAVEQSTELVYIVQRGGIAGTQTVFGPFRAEDGCWDFPSTEYASIAIEGDGR